MVKMWLKILLTSLCFLCHTHNVITEENPTSLLLTQPSKQTHFKRRIPTQIHCYGNLSLSFVSRQTCRQRLLHPWHAVKRPMTTFYFFIYWAVT